MFGHNIHVSKSGVLLLLCPFRGELGHSPSNTVWPGPRPTSVLSMTLHFVPFNRLSTINTGRKVGSAVPPLGGAGSPSNTLWPGLRTIAPCTKWHLDPPSHLASTDSGRKSSACAPFLGELGPHLTQCRLGRGISPYQVASQSIQPFGHNVGQKLGAVPLLGSGELGPHLTQCGVG